MSQFLTNMHEYDINDAGPMSGPCGTLNLKPTHKAYAHS